MRSGRIDIATQTILQRTPLEANYNQLRLLSLYEFTSWSMSVTQIEILIKQSDQLFTKRSLEAALETAKEAYELSNSSTYTPGIIQSS